MAFQLKDFTSIVASMINHIRGTTDKLTDFNVGAVNRVLVEAPAVEIDELYQQMFYGLKESIPTAIYLSFDFEKLKASLAYTVITFTANPAPITNPIVIPKGTSVRVPDSDVFYTTDQEVSIPAAQTEITVRVTANTTGITGNTLANTITEMDAQIGTVTVNNLDAVVSGRDEETEPERKLRFRGFIETLSRGPIAAIEYGARTAVIKDGDGNVSEFIKNAFVYEPYLTDLAQPLGYIHCYIFNGVDSASAEIIAETQKIINGYYDIDLKRIMGWKAAGIICTVFAVTKFFQDVTVTVVPDNDKILSDISTEVDTVIRDYITNLQIGEKIVRNELIKAIQNIPGVYNSIMAIPSNDIVLSHDDKSLPGTITIN